MERPWSEMRETSASKNSKGKKSQAGDEEQSGWLRKWWVTFWLFPMNMCGFPLPGTYMLVQPSASYFLFASLALSTVNKYAFIKVSSNPIHVRWPDTQLQVCSPADQNLTDRPFQECFKESLWQWVKPFNSKTLFFMETLSLTIINCKAQFISELPSKEHSFYKTTNQNVWRWKC